MSNETDEVLLYIEILAVKYITILAGP